MPDRAAGANTRPSRPARKVCTGNGLSGSPHREHTIRYPRQCIPIHLIKEISPDFVVTEYIYNEKGNLIEEKTYTPLGEGPDAPRTNESSITYEWDDKGRKIKTTYINDKFLGDRSDWREYTDDDPEIQYIYYSSDDKYTSYMKYDWNDEYVDCGIIDENDGQIYLRLKRNIKYEFWDNGKIKTKKIYKDNTGIKK